jgi:hypothetical protein
MKLPLSQQLERIVLAYLEDANTPRSLAIACLMKAREYGQLFSMKVDPKLYNDAEDLFLDVQATEFLRKLRLDVGGIDRHQVALDSFWESERQCCRTNVRLSRYVNNGPFEDPTDVRISSFLDDVREIIDGWLGPVPRDLDLRHGPGATFEDRRHYTTVPDKMTSRPTVTEDARCVLPLWEETAWARALYRDKPWNSEPRTVRGNRFTSVPKDGLKNRGICVEPSVNVAYQLAVGRHLKRRLLFAGIDLKEGQTAHRLLARDGSRYGTLATIDLTSASDTVSYQLVKAVMPARWFDVLDALRSPYTRVKRKWVKLEKFSSMGNGYTFELETIIFAALAQACADRTGHQISPGKGIWVYGDDIIVPRNLADTLLPCLRWCGFTPNPRKTFVSGRFRESCGGDFYDGIPVRGHNIEEEPTEPQHFISLANGLRRVAKAHGAHPRRWHVVKRAWMRCLDMLPLHVRRLRGPPTLGDTVIHDDQWTTIQGTGDQQGWELVRAYVPVSPRLEWKHWHPSVVLASALYGLPTEGVAPRGAVSGYRIKLITCLEGCDPELVLGST